MDVVSLVKVVEVVDVKYLKKRLTTSRSSGREALKVKEKLKNILEVPEIVGSSGS